MKKIFPIFLVLVIAVTFAGCAPKTAGEEIAYPWAVILVMSFQLSSTSVPEGAVEALSKKLDLKNISHEKDTLKVGLYFKTYDDFSEYFDVTHINRKDQNTGGVETEIVRKSFTYERTITFENPWKTVLENRAGVIESIRTETVKLFSTSLKSSTPEYYYVLLSDYRRTRVPGAVSSTNLLGVYEYSFIYGPDPESVDEILIFDRFANSPAWYGVAVGATAFFMIVTYIVFAKTKRKRYNKEWLLQSSPTSTET